MYSIFCDHNLLVLRLRKRSFRMLERHIRSCQANESDMTARLTTLRSNLSDIEYVGNNANRLMKMIRACLLEVSVVLYCTGTKSAESSSCSCGVKTFFKPKKLYTEIYNQAKKTVNASLDMVIFFNDVLTQLKLLKLQPKLCSNTLTILDFESFYLWF